uniref:Glutamate-rich WD repeat-containing protein 1 n=1 Tax=Wollemia nobilis TaxID=56998 RepID=A0A0C9S618_9CONI
MARNIKKKKVPKKTKPVKKGEGASKSVQQSAKVWQPGVDKLEEGEELQCDISAYDCLHAFHIGWPCLSFDIVRDTLGLVRTEFPHTVYCVAGTQADRAASNVIGISRLSNISGKKRKLLPVVSDEDESESDSSSDEEDDSMDDSGMDSKKPTLQVRMVAHQGCVNRIRSMEQQPHIVATWADNGYVQVWDFSAHLNSLATSDPRMSTGMSNVTRQAPLQIFSGHKDEGFALDWSPVTPGRLLSGDCQSCINLWEPTSDGKWIIDKSFFKGHTDSVEDLQWSPTEANVFASCSVDRTVAIWDARVRDQPVISVKAHDADVNVISWNRLASCMIASGSDDGSFSIWDLRSFKEDSLVAHFTYHKHPVTSIEWSSHEASTLAVSSADNQLTIWDLSLERDEEEEAEFKKELKEIVDAPEDLPPQLLFVHQGQKDLKEVHWHAQIPGLLMSTAADGFNVLKPSNIENVLPQQ